MRRFTLAPYTVRVRPPYSKEYELLDSFGETDNDLFVELRRIIGALKATDNAAISQVLEITKIDVGVRDRLIEGVAESGEYGTETIIRDTKTWNVAHEKKAHHAEMLPFYFLLHLPEGCDKGILLLERIGTFGIQNSFAAMINAAFVHDFPNRKIIINPLVPEDLVDQYLGDDAELSEIRFIRHSLTGDIANHLGRGGERGGTMELSVKLRERDGFPFKREIRRYLRGQRELANLLELEDTRFHYDTVKLKVWLNGRYHTIDLGNPKRLRAAFDLSDEVKLLGGFPTFQSISEAAKAKLADLSAQMYGR